MSISYADAGVDIAAGNEAVNRIKQKVAQTFSPNVIGGIGGFGAMFDLKSALAPFDHPVMVQSIDGCGTKTLVAKMAGDFSNIGHDLLSACANDILVLGATSLTLLDYIANDKLNPDTIETIISGMCDACKENGVSLVGGEMAEMPDTYLPGEHDVVGIVTGVVDKAKIIDGSNITPGDKVYALASSGLHTNGFSLARKVFFEVAKHKIDDYVDALGMSVAEALLAPHINYTNPVHALIEAGAPIKGQAHITGGGLIENIPRVLPEGCGVEIKKGSWDVLPVFNYIQSVANIDEHEMFCTFNMGLGWIIIAPEDSRFIEAGMQLVGEVVPEQGVCLLAASGRII